MVALKLLLVSSASWPVLEFGLNALHLQLTDTLTILAGLLAVLHALAQRSGVQVFQKLLVKLVNNTSPTWVG
jgi:hypothetical protein